MSATEVISPPQAPRSEQAKGGGFRPDIEGLRAVAVTLVVLSHAGVAVFAGGYVGVDVFFVISGFLITTLLVKEINRSGRISLTGFYARRALRLLPASTLVLVVTVAGSWLWLPATRFTSIAKDALVSTFYGINWRLAYEGVQYLNADAAPSPLQHFWSLAVEEQFYLVWPLLLIVTAAALRKHVLALIVVVSFVASVVLTQRSAPWAYFGAHTRAWELGIGALVAVAVPVFPPLIGRGLSGIGLVAIVASGLVFGEQTAFPGYAAALPVLGAALVIAGGRAAPLRAWPLQKIGKYSYSWYLWHWPILMIGPAALHRNASLPLGLALAAASFPVAMASYHLVENPVRTWGWIKARVRRGLAAGLVLSASAAAFALVTGAHPPVVKTGGTSVDTAAAIASADDPEAALEKLVASSVKLKKLPANVVPGIEQAAADSPQVYADHCHLDYTHTAADNPCVYGDPNGTKTVFLLGDSHGAHWFPAMQALAEQNHWRLLTRTKGACQAPSVLVYNNTLKRQYDECVTWRNDILDEIARTRPALVVMSSNGGDGGGIVDKNDKRIDQGPDRDQLWAKAWTATFTSIARSPGTRMAMIEDTPWPGRNAPECVAANSTRLTACAAPVGKAILEPARRSLVAAAATSAGVTVIDPTPWFCTTTCPPVVGNILVWKDDSHITTYYSRMLARLLGPKLPI